MAATAQKSLKIFFIVLPVERVVVEIAEVTRGRVTCTENRSFEDLQTFTHRCLIDTLRGEDV